MRNDLFIPEVFALTVFQIISCKHRQIIVVKRAGNGKGLTQQTLQLPQFPLDFLRKTPRRFALNTDFFSSIGQKPIVFEHLPRDIHLLQAKGVAAKGI